MAKMTLLEMVQNILSAIDSDEVNSITDTVESLQVAEIIKETFDEQFAGIDIPEFYGLIQISSVSDVTRPNYLKLPTNVTKMEWLKYRDYRNNNKFRDLYYCSPEEFLHRQLQLSSGDNTELTTDISGIQYYIYNTRTPTYYTIFDDLYIATDSYDSENESVLQTTNTIGYGLKAFTFEMADAYVPPIDATLFPLLLAESKSTAFVNLKQISSAKEEQRARRQRVRMQRDLYRTNARKYMRYYKTNYARQR